VVIDDHVDGAVDGQGVVAGAGLAVDDGQDVEAGGGQFFDGRERDLEDVDHGPVLGAADDPAQGQGGLQAGLVLDQPLEPDGGGQGVGIGVVVHVDQHRLLAPDLLQGVGEVDGGPRRCGVVGWHGQSAGRMRTLS
jgi:hypothetical protein